MTLTLHIGRGTDRGALSVFPVWTDGTVPRTYSLSADTARLAEHDVEKVSSLVVTNPGDHPLLLLEGQLLQGGLQHRMLVRSTMVPASGSASLDVLCVEQGRWSGGREQRSTGDRAALAVRGAAAQGQGGVWSRVAGYDQQFGANPTQSFVEHARRADADVARLIDGLAPLDGQAGVVIGIGGQPVMMEVFDSPSTLRRQYRSILRAAALDALGNPAVRTPSRRAVRFADRANAVVRTPSARAGAGVTSTGADQYARVTTLDWQDRVVHLQATNVRHTLVQAPAAA
ncbi:hypothetical protein SAMN04489860_2291 [Paraoerskovia marina]|uniref:ARG and Rhodanese-Phosphatase-superfamily-associated domain-containing protein n=1 Tax=Paraoerskovia marina TaxID=545619 RepID=A0A1H1USY7_9CELL|nr:DUF6569 family protein [Paraoerskovia marina]SDS75704.1 hypothetical protein SAMN04489860_2291 [Paraoerskovia marina]